MIDVLDAHMHTIASGHAYSTLNEMIASGKKKKPEKKSPAETRKPAETPKT